LKGNNQMVLFGNMKNPMRFKDRTALENYLKENIPSVADMITEV